MRSRGSLQSTISATLGSRGQWVVQPAGRLHTIAAERLLMGVPWGTLVIVTFVAASYLFVQDGFTDFSDPVTIPYRSWSYFSPLGVLTASFAHAGPNHLLGNLTGTLVAAPIAEYAWGHYPPGREGARRWRDDPRVRAVVIFPLAAIAVGLVTSLFALGPVIGFSGVVFAFAGFAIVRYPIATLVATVAVQGALLTTLRAIQAPILVHVAEPSPASAPGWATIAIQGHGLGFLIGLVLGIVLLERRGVSPSAGRLWLSLVLFGISKGLWQIYWFGEGNAYILFQLPGLVIVLTLATIVTLAVTASDADVLPARVDRYLARLPFYSRTAGSDDEGTADRATGFEWPLAESESGPVGQPMDSASQSKPLSPQTRRGLAFTTVMIVCAVVAGIAIPVNLVVVDADHSPESAIEVGDYTISYGEGVENQLVSGVGFDSILEGSALEANGVIVASDTRSIWSEEISTDRLAFTGSERITVGGPGWRETVQAERTGWEPVGNDTVYQVHLSKTDSDRQLAFESDGGTMDVQLHNRSVGLVSVDGEFYVTVGPAGADVGSLEAETRESEPVPDSNESVTVDGITITNQEETLAASVEETVVAVAAKETYD